MPSIIIKMTDKRMTDCYICYLQYQEDKTFNYDCPIYKERLSLGKDKDKCLWIDIAERETFESKKILEELIKVKEFIKEEKLKRWNLMNLMKC